jgi:hypothetical protein
VNIEPGENVGDALADFYPGVEKNALGMCRCRSQSNNWLIRKVFSVPNSPSKVDKLFADLVFGDQPVSASSISLVRSRGVRPGQPAQATHQGHEPWPVFLTHSCELHPHAAARFHVLNDGVGTYLAFWHKEVEINDRSRRFDR